MKVLYIHQYFITPKEPGGTRSYWLAKELIKNGHEVVMITSATKFQESIKYCDIDGIQVIYIKEDYNQNMSIIRRLWAFISFSLKSIKTSFKVRNVDLVFATSTPLTVGIPALFLKWFRRTPFIFEVRDLWPEVPIQMNAIKNPLLIHITRGLEKLIYKQANHVIALSPGMEDGVAKYIPRRKISMIPNMSKKNEFWPREKNEKILQSLKLNSNSFKVIHFGSLGLANGVETILNSAKLMGSVKDVEFIFIGGGSTEAGLKEYCTENGIKNVKFLGKFPMELTSEIVNFCDVSIVSFSDIPILYTNSPNKLFDSLSAGKVIIVNSAGWTKDLVEKEKCGFYVDPNNPMDLVEKINVLRTNPELMREFEKKARWLAENIYDKSILCDKFVKVIEDNV